jgi:transcription initiation factor TFIIE subunit beta
LPDSNQKLAFDIFNSEELLSHLKAHDRLVFDDITSTFAYQHKFSIKSKDDLLQILKLNRHNGGIEYKDLKESFSGIPAILEELVMERHALVSKNPKDDTPRIVFFNDRNLDMDMSDEFIKMWDEVYTIETYGFRLKCQ